MAVNLSFTSKAGADYNSDRQDAFIEIVLASILFVLGTTFAALSCFLWCTYVRSDINKAKRWSGINRSVAFLIDGAILFPMVSVSIINGKYIFLQRTTCFVVLVLQLFAFVGHYSTVFAYVAVMKISLFNPLSSDTTLSQRCGASTISLVWVVNAVYVTVPTLVFILREDVPSRETVVIICTWKSMYPDPYLYFVVYTMMVPGFIIWNYTMLKVMCLVKRHRQQIDTQIQTVISGQQNVYQIGASKVTKTCKSGIRYLPTAFAIIFLNVTFIINLHCVDCIPHPWDIFLQWFFFGIPGWSDTTIQCLKNRICPTICKCRKP